MRVPPLIGAFPAFLFRMWAWLLIFLLALIAALLPLVILTHWLGI
jgi:hypothetical protein